MYIQNTQTDKLLNAKEGSFITTLPIIKNLNLLTGQIELILTDDFIYSVDDKRDAAQVDAQIVSKLAGINPKQDRYHKQLRSADTNKQLLRHNQHMRDNV